MNGRSARHALHLAFAQALCSFLLVNSVRVLLTLYALKLGARDFTVGALGAMLYVLPLLLVWSVGRMFDRFGARWLLIFGGACGAAGLVIPSFLPTVDALFAAAFLCGVALAFSNVILQGLVGSLSSDDERTRNFSNFSIVVSSASFIGPLMVGVAIDHLGYQVACMILALAPLGGVLLMLVWGGKLPRGNQEPGQADALLKSLLDLKIRRMLAVSSLMQVGLDLFQFYLPIYGHSIGLSASSIGVVMAAYATASIVARFAMPWFIDSWGDERLLSLAFFFGGLIFLSVPLLHNLLFLALASFLFGVCMGCGGPLTLMLMFKHAPAGRPGETLGLRLTVNYLTRMVGPTLFGLVASLTGLPAVFVLNAGLMGVGSLLSRPRNARASLSPRRHGDGHRE